MVTATKRKPAPAKAKKNVETPKGVRLDEIPIASIDASPSNPRTEFDDDELNHLAASIGKHGLLQPVVVRKDGTRYQLVAGDRRMRAAQRAGRKTIAAVVRDVSDSDALVLGLIENIEREDLNPVDTARAVARLCEPEAEGGAGMSHVDAGAMLSRDVSWIRRQLQLLKLPEVWLKRVVAGDLNASMAHVLLPYAHRPAVLARIEDDMLANPWAWRTVEDFERNAKLVAESNGTTTKPSAPSELKPRRASPGDGERKRESRGAVGSAPPAAAASPAAGLERDADGDVGRSTTSTATPAQPQSSVDLDQLLAMVRQLNRAEDLERVAEALEERRRGLAN